MRKHAAGRGGVEPGGRAWVNSVISLSRFIALIVKEARPAEPRIVSEFRVAFGRARCDRALRVYAGAIPRPAPTVPKG